MKDIGISFDDILIAAKLLKRYALAVESKLYINMKINEAYEEIDEANRLAFELEELASKIDTVSPEDLG